MKPFPQSQAERIDRILRALRLSGRRLVCNGGKWQVRADRRRWLAIGVFPEDVDLLMADGKLGAACGGGYVLTAAAVEEITAADASEPPFAGPWIHVVAGSGRKALGHGFRGLAMRAESGEGPLTLRQAAAGLKLVADAEQAGRVSGLTMNWEAGPVDKRRRGGRLPDFIHAARKADQRLSRVRDILGDAFALVWSACIEQFPMSRLERRHKLPPRGAAAALAAALEELADVYDGIAARSPGMEGRLEGIESR